MGRERSREKEKKDINLVKQQSWTSTKRKNFFKSWNRRQLKMGTAEELCLRWNDFETILSRSFAEMRDDSDFFDVRIACFDEKSVMKQFQPTEWFYQPVLQSSETFYVP